MGRLLCRSEGDVLRREKIGRENLLKMGREREVVAERSEKQQDLTEQTPPFTQSHVDLPSYTSQRPSELYSQSNSTQYIYPYVATSCDCHAPLFSASQVREWLDARRALGADGSLSGLRFEDTLMSFLEGEGGSGRAIKGKKTPAKCQL